ncbi:hypothetical protein J6590_005126 [Homalodisca vitripennis]|nr:hypothetical protein J6590_005126 [Homalodisca vitripennis]
MYIHNIHKIVKREKQNQVKDEKLRGQTLALEVYLFHHIPVCERNTDRHNDVTSVSMVALDQWEPFRGIGRLILAYSDASIERERESHDVTRKHVCRPHQASNQMSPYITCGMPPGSTAKDNKSDSEKGSSDSDFFQFSPCVCAIFRCDTTGMDRLTVGDSLNETMFQKRNSCLTTSNVFSSSDMNSDHTMETYHCSREDSAWRIQPRHLHRNPCLIYSLSSKSLKAFVFYKWTLFLMVILLSPLLVFGSPAHRVRHRHLRHTLRSDQLCGKQEELARPASENCHHHPRVRRNINSMTLREGQETSLCAYRVCVDEDKNRLPIHIHRVYCLNTGCRCTHEGQYRCTQLYNNVEVWYGANQTQSKPMTRGTLEVEFGCVCAAKHGTSVEPFVPDSVD